MRVPETKYVKSGNYHIAYPAAGDGPPDLAFVTGYLGNVEAWWEAPAPSAFFERLASFARVIHSDKRGTGLSDHVDPTNLPTLEERADDLSRVLDAVRSERIALLGYSEGGMLSTLYAAAHPDRVSHLILIGSVPRFEPFADFDIEQWGSGPMLDVLAPSLRDDGALRQLYATFERRTASPGSARTLMTMINGIDLTDIFPPAPEAAAVVYEPAIGLNRRQQRRSSGLIGGHHRQRSRAVLWIAGDVAVQDRQTRPGSRCRRGHGGRCSPSGREPWRVSRRPDQYAPSLMVRS